MLTNKREDPRRHQCQNQNSQGPSVGSWRSRGPARAHLRGLRALGRLHDRELRALRVHLVRRARPHRRGARLGRGNGDRRLRVVGARLCRGVYRPLLRGPHVHTPRGLPLRLEHAQARHGAPHAHEPGLLRHARLGRPAPRGGRVRPRDRGASRPQASGHGGLGGHDLGHARALLRLRLASGRRLPRPGRREPRLHVLHDGRSRHGLHDALHGVAS